MKSQYESGGIRIIKDKALNERDYGELVGLNKAETIENVSILFETLPLLLIPAVSTNKNLLPLNLK